MPYPDLQYEQSWKMQASSVTMCPGTPAQHTPGPWGYDTDSREIFSDTDDHGAGWIALVRGSDSKGWPLPWPVRMANAWLIAAAPDLLAAARLANQELIDLGQGSSASPALRALWMAIAKAEGREVHNG